MSSFEIAVNEVVDPQEWIDFKVGGQDCKAMAQPTGGQIAYVTLYMHKAKRDQTQAGALLNFLDSLLEDESQEYIMDLLLDPKNDFDIEKLMSILEWLMEQWTARPTVPSSDSSLSPTTPGPTSEPPTPQPTSFAFLPAGS